MSRSGVAMFEVGDLIKIKCDAYEGAFEDDIGFILKNFNGYFYVYVFIDNGLELPLKTQDIQLYVPNW